MSALTDVFTAIANAIRSKKGVSTTYKPSEMASAINSIQIGRTVTERVLWTNPSPTSSFGAQTVTFSSTFDCTSETLLIRYAKNTVQTGSTSEDTIMYNFKWVPDYGVIGGDSYKWHSRSFQRSGSDTVHWTGLSISNAFEQGSGNIDNIRIIPTKISAIRGINDL